MSWRTTAVLSILLTTSALTAGFAQEVGVLAAVNRDMTGERPTEAPRQIFLQDKLVTNERIETSAEGGGQVLFLDQTSLTITKNSQIVLDKYVYDPESEAGEMGVSVLKGAMRIVGGRITKKKPALIRTPSATIGIRGGIGNVTVRPDGSTIYMHVAGISSTIEGVGEDVLTITREGGVAVIQGEGEVEYVGVADPDTVQQIYNSGATGEGDGKSTEADAGGGQQQGQQQQQQQQQGQQQQGGQQQQSGQQQQQQQGGQQQDDQQQAQQQGGEQDERQQTEERASQLGNENSGDEEAAAEGPISTQGERQQRNQARPEVEIENDGQEEQADNVVEEVAQEIAGDIDQNIDQIFFSGTYSPTLLGGSSPGVSPNLNFEMVYSLNDEQGLVQIELPGAVVNGAGSETFAGDPIIADSFVVGGANIQALTGDAALGTLLGGNPGGVLLSISPDTRVSGDIDIDYSFSSIVDADSLTADLAPVLGDPVNDIGGASVLEIVDDFRQIQNGN